MPPEIKTPIDSLVETLALQIGERAAAIAVERVNEALAQNSGFLLGWLEEDLAKMFECSEQTLYLKRKSSTNREIGYTKTPSGKVFYMVHHVVEYLLKHEVKASTQTMELADVLHFPQVTESVKRAVKKSGTGR